MRYISTRGASPPVSLAVAVQSGTAPDGGLYLPESIEPLPGATIDSFRDADLPSIAARVMAPFLGPDLSGDAIRRLAADALDFPVPRVQIDGRSQVVELFHGPTLAFKDIAARVLARLLALFAEPEKGVSTVLVATSGDTGGAVAQAFHGVEGTRVVVLYPHGRVSDLQERQFATLGGNVTALAVDGTFDDCQRLAKEAFSADDLRRRARLISANSINIGRLLPQMAYWFYAAAGVTGTSQPWIAVPSGNLGSLTAGLMARRLGLEATPIAATNANDSLPRYLRSGTFEPHPTVPTLSTAMDVGEPSNFERIVALSPDRWPGLREEIRYEVVDDGATRSAMIDLADRHGYLIDPHGAVGWVGLQRALVEAPSSCGGAVLATAHPAKFPRRVAAATGRPPEVPVTLQRVLERPVVRVEIGASLDALRPFLEAGGAP